ncbi:MAG: beta-ketoacyl-ACP synthase III [Acidimicrobiales bacterium]
MAGVITGWGTALPDTVVTNADLEARLDTTDEWIVERSGIRERRWGGTVASLSVEAARRALDRSGVRPADVDLLVLATTTPDEAVPATSAAVHRQLGLGGGAFDLNAACAGFVYGLVVAHGALAIGARRALVVGCDVLSRITDPDDRGTAVLFADGAGAVVLESSPGDRGGLCSFDLGVDGEAHDLLVCAHGGTLRMEGREVFRRAVRITVDTAQKAMKDAGIAAEHVALFVPHQANLRIIEAAASRLGIPMARTAVVLDRTGNTSSASIPLALAEAADQGRLRPGDHVLMAGFGAGMTWASAVVRWAAAPAA